MYMCEYCVWNPPPGATASASSTRCCCWRAWSRWWFPTARLGEWGVRQNRTEQNRTISIELTRRVGAVLIDFIHSFIPSLFIIFLKFSVFVWRQLVWPGCFITALHALHTRHTLHFTGCRVTEELQRQEYVKDMESKQLHKLTFLKDHKDKDKKEK